MSFFETAAGFAVSCCRDLPSTDSVDFSQVLYFAEPPPNSADGDSTHSLLALACA